MEIPEGWQLVPVEPTEEMSAAYMRVKPYSVRNDGIKTSTAEYKAMLAAAPTPPEQEQDDEPIYLVFSNDTYYDGSWEFANKDEFDKANEDDRYKLYTRPDNSGLRKVAELVAHTERNHALIKITERSATYLALGTPLYTRTALEGK